MANNHKSFEPHEYRFEAINRISIAADDIMALYIYTSSKSLHRKLYLGHLA